MGNLNNYHFLSEFRAHNSSHVAPVTASREEDFGSKLYSMLIGNGLEGLRKHHRCRAEIEDSSNPWPRGVTTLMSVAHPFMSIVAFRVILPLIPAFAASSVYCASGPSLVAVGGQDNSSCPNRHDAKSNTSIKKGLVFINSIRTLRCKHCWR